MNEQIKELETIHNQTEFETTKSVDGHIDIGDSLDLGDELHDFDFGDGELHQTKTIGETVIRKPNIFSEKEAEIRAAAQAAFEKYGPVTVIIVNDKSHSVLVEKKQPASASKREFKPWVKPFFGLSAVVVTAALIISWMY